MVVQYACCSCTCLAANKHPHVDMAKIEMDYGTLAHTLKLGKHCAAPLDCSSLGLQRALCRVGGCCGCSWLQAEHHAGESCRWSEMVLQWKECRGRAVHMLCTAQVQLEITKAGCFIGALICMFQEQNAQRWSATLIACKPPCTHARNVVHDL